MKKILVADDEEQNLDYLQTLFQSQGFLVTIAVNGAKALEAARKNPPDIIISDILMPVMDGFMLCREWKNDSRLQKIPFVFYTATYTDPKDEKLALDMGADLFLIKPQEPDVLLDMAQKIIDSKSERMGKIPETEISEEDILKEYNEALFRKLKQKINQLEEANETIKESETKYRSIFQNSMSGIFQITKKGQLLVSNPALYLMFGYVSLDELTTTIKDIGKQVYVNHEDHDNLISLLKQNNFVDGYETRLFKKDGSIIWIKANIWTIRNDNNHLLFYEGIVEDITDRIQKEEELKKYHEHLEDLVRERTAELESFSYSVSHDLRAPLRTIDGFSQALVENCEDKLNAHDKDYLFRIRAAARHMGSLIEDMLQLSRITRTEMNIEKTNLTRIARSIINELQQSQPQRDVEIRIADGLEDKADSRLMRIVLENLLGNAWKFTQKQSEQVIEFGFTTEGDKKIYFIRDNGAGFDMMYANKLFTPFQRLHTVEEYPGTGIGLATVRRIIHRHGGKIWAEGQTGKGATFYFTLHE